MECELIAMRYPTQLKTIEYRGALITDVVAPEVPVPAAAADPSD